MTMTITVSADAALENLHTAAGHHPRSCPVARAIRAATGISFVAVSAYEIRVGDVWLPTPSALFAWLKKYDVRRNPGPLSFELETTSTS